MRKNILAILTAMAVIGSDCYAHKNLDLDGYDRVTAKTLIAQVKEAFAALPPADCQQTLNPSNSAITFNQELARIEVLINSVDGSSALYDILTLLIQPIRQQGAMSVQSHQALLTAAQPQEVFHRPGFFEEAAQKRLTERQKYAIFFLPGKGLFLAVIHSPLKPINRYALYKLKPVQFFSLLDNLQAKLEE